jgi:predicted transposase YdaD
MQTDLPLKRLTRLCAADLLPWLGAPDATVVGVATLELPARTTSLDTVLRLRDPDGHEYLHLVEWQGYTDPTFLWRTLGYLAWLGEHRAERPILVTLVYLKPGDDVGQLLEQAPGQAGGWAVRFACLRLWQQDAAAAVASGLPGLLALSPLLGGATAALIEQAAQTIIAQVAPPTQGELLATLGIFAAPFLETERFIRLVTKERLMSTDLINYLLQDKVAEFEQEKAALEQQKAIVVQEKAALEKAALEARLVQALQEAIEDAITARFPTAPLALTRPIRQTTEPTRLQALLRGVLTVADLAAVERLLREEQSA